MDEGNISCSFSTVTDEGEIHHSYAEKFELWSLLVIVICLWYNQKSTVESTLQQLVQLAAVLQMCV